jgi:hypothetical protein
MYYIFQIKYVSCSRSFPMFKRNSDRPQQYYVLIHNI